MKIRRRTLAHRLVLLVLLGLPMGVMLCLGVGHWYSKAAPGVIDELPLGIRVEEVSLTSLTGTEIRGWLSEVDQAVEARGVVLLLHGIRSDRRSMLTRARVYSSQGYHTLSIDFQAHGESPGKRITLGYLESKNASAAVGWLQARFPRKPIIVHGTSLGGASAVMARYEKPPDALVIESVFADVETAAANRLEMVLGKWARGFHPLLTLQIKPFIGVSPKELSPLEKIKECNMPILIVHGKDDKHAEIWEARLLRENAGGHCELWEIEDYGHEGLLARDPDEWTATVMDFLDRQILSE